MPTVLLLLGWFVLVAGLTAGCWLLVHFAVRLFD